MGLLEKRVAKQYEENELPKLVAEINALAGFDVEFSINWESIAVEDQTNLYHEAFTKIYFDPIIGAFKDITQDTMGKDALKKLLKKIVIQNTSDISYSKNAFSFDNATLTIDHAPTTNIDQVDERTKDLTNLLMKLM
jgi:hypothetical protein